MSNESPSASVSGWIERSSGYVASALRFWEPMRLPYNGVLALVVTIHMASSGQATSLLWRDRMLVLILLAVLANVCYCAVYLVDLFVRFSGLDSAWKVGRFVVWFVGTTFAAVLTHFFSLGIMSQAP